MKNNKEIIKYLDLFGGIGGFHQAASCIKSKNFELEQSVYCEIDPQARLLYNEFISKKNENHQIIEDAKEIKTHKNKLGKELNSFDMLFAGFPCQSFSNVGYRKGLDDERGQLFYNILDILDYYKPKYFVLENVQKLSTINKGELLEEMKEALKNIGNGYRLYVWDLIASDYGLPQKRKRLFFCGVEENENLPDFLNPPPKIILENAKYPTVWHLLEKDTVDPKHYIPSGTRKTILYKNPKWQGDVNIDNYLARPITASMSKWHRANQDNYISDHYVKNKNPYIRPEVNLETDKIRRITPLEGFRIQGFPDVFYQKALNIKLSYSAQYRLIGNAVPVELAKNVIEYFLENCNGNKTKSRRV
jgi:DNA (cytosine-5)-methyltransferase 1